MLTAEQHDEFRTTGLLRLDAAFPPAAAETMCDRLWEFLAERYAIDHGERSTWTVEKPTGFQAVTHSGVFQAVGGDPLSTALDSLFGVDRWVRPRWWGRPLVTFPGPERWLLPAREWHFDFMPASAGHRPVQFFAFVNEARPGGGGTLALAGSYRLVAPYLARGEAFRMGEVRASLAADPWLRGLWEPERSRRGAGGERGDDRTERYLNDGATVDGVPLRVVELTGEPGDVSLMHCDTFHAAAPNRLTEPRMMLTGMIEPEPAPQVDS